MTIENLTVADHDVLITRQIEQAPVKTMIREFVQNGFEAEREYKKQEKVVEFYGTEIEVWNGEEWVTVRKLAIKNNGTGMTDKELYASTNLSSSIRKSMGVGHNYGIGGKVSGLKSNPAGIRYRSCHNGIVSEVTLKKEGNYYGREKDLDSNETVFIVTDEYKESDLENDWTELVLYGHKLLDDTVRVPFGKENPISENWINTFVNHRYYRFPEGTRIIYHEGILSAAQGKRELLSWEQMFLRKKDIRVETVDSGNGYSVIYALNNAASWITHRHSTRAAAGIVYKNEIFDVANGNKLIGESWGKIAPKFGIPFGSSSISIFIMLDDDYPVSMNNYRTEIQDDMNEKVCLTDFTQAVSILMPEWLKEFIDTERNKHTGNSGNIKKRIAELIKTLDLNQKAYKPKKDGAVLTDIDSGVNGIDGERKSKHTHAKRMIVRKPGGNTPSANSKGFRDIPEMDFLRTEEEVKEKGLQGYAASYADSDKGWIFINALHPVYKQREEEVLNEFADVVEDPTGREIVIQAYEDEYLFNVVASVLFARSEWKRNHWDKALLEDLLKESTLTVSLAKDLRMISNVKQRLGNNKELIAIRSGG